MLALFPQCKAQPAHGKSEQDRQWAWADGRRTRYFPGLRGTPYLVLGFVTLHNAGRAYLPRRRTALCTMLLLLAGAAVISRNARPLSPDLPAPVLKTQLSKNSSHVLVTTVMLDVLPMRTHLRRASSTYGGEFAGPCPFCAGTDRFRAWPDQQRPGWWCRVCRRGVTRLH